MAEHPSPDQPPHAPVPANLEPGVHFLCACGKTSHTPFCDGSHKGTGIQPRRIEISEKKTISTQRARPLPNQP